MTVLVAAAKLLMPRTSCTTRGYPTTRTGGCSEMRESHGHNYILEAVVAGEIDQASGYVLDLKLLSDVMCGRSIRDVDHRT